MGKAPNVEMTAVDKKYWDDSLELEFLRAGDGALVSTLNGKQTSSMREFMRTENNHPKSKDNHPKDNHPKHLSLDSLGGEAKPESFLR